MVGSFERERERERERENHTESHDVVRSILHFGANLTEDMPSVGGDRSVIICSVENF